jgi:hypothetical protein
MKTEYRNIKIGPARLDMIGVANQIIEEYQAQGFVLTVRQLYYQFVARDLIRNNQREYKKLGALISDGRLAGLIDWDALEDRTRSVEEITTWADPASILRGVIAGYKTDRWWDQEMRFEVWIEKEALAGVFEPICTELEIPFFCCRGYTSLSAMHEAYERLEAHTDAGQTVYILHFGDHDPSGMDMSRHIVDQLNEFGLDLELDRLALNMDQVAQYNPPPNPAKMTDSRAEGYVMEYGYDSWELDALEPAVLADLVRSTVEAYRDHGKWAEAVADDEKDIDAFRAIAGHWGDVRRYAEGLS